MERTPRDHTGDVRYGPCVTQHTTGSARPAAPAAHAASRQDKRTRTPLNMNRGTGRSSHPNPVSIAPRHAQRRTRT